MTPLPSVPWASVGIYDDQRSFTAQHSQFLANHILMSTLIDFVIIIVGKRSNTDFFCKGRGGAGGYPPNPLEIGSAKEGVGLPHKSAKTGIFGP